MKKYLDILGIGYGLSIEEIKVAYKKMAMKYHPDRNHGFKEEAEKKMKALNEARDYILNNFREYNNYRGESERKEYKKEYREERQEEKKQERKTESKKEEKAVDNDKISRLKKVLFFVGLIMVPFIANWLGIGITGDYIINLVVYFLPYIIILDFFTRIIFFVNIGKDKGILTKRLYEQLFIIYLILFTIAFVVDYYIDEYNRKLEYDCTFKNMDFHNYGLWGGYCVCKIGYKENNEGNCEEKIEQTEQNASKIRSVNSIEKIPITNENIEVDNTYSMSVLQDVNLRDNPGVNSKKLTVLKKGDNIKVYSQKVYNGELWYEVDGRDFHGWINYIAFAEQEVVDNNVQNISAEVDIPGVNYTNNQGVKVQGYSRQNNTSYFDCGEGGRYNDSFKECFCNPGYGKGVDGRCIKRDCGIGGSFNSSFNECFCNPGYGKGVDGKCIMIDCGIGGSYNDSFNECFCNPGYGKLSDGKCYK